MSQTFVSPSAWTGDHFSVEGSEAHHLIRVLRRKVGDEIEIFDGAGHRALGKIVSVHENPPQAEGNIVRELTSSKKEIRIHLYQGLPRGSKFDFVLEKATELGVDAVIPFLSQKNPIKLTPDQSESKLKRWNAVVKAAAKQCGSAEIPVVEGPRPLMDFADRFQAGPTFVLWEKEKSSKLEGILASKPDQATASILIGPEAGFTSEEIDGLIRLAVKPVSLGSRILRAETAGLAILSILNYSWGLF